MTVSNGITLVCTVGGSHQPIVTAIKTHEPDRVVFFCTGTDPATGRAGSCSQVEGKGLIIRASPQDDKPTLPAIPEQCGLAEGQWEVVEVPADDLDEAYAIMRQTLTRLADEGRQVIADYTGGTKTMTAALVLAALDDGRAELQSVTGARVDLVKVRDGTQAAGPATVERIRFLHDVKPALAAWRRFAGTRRRAAWRPWGRRATLSCAPNGSGRATSRVPSPPGTASTMRARWRYLELTMAWWPGHCRHTIPP